MFARSRLHSVVQPRIKNLDARNTELQDFLANWCKFSLANPQHLWCSQAVGEFFEVPIRIVRHSGNISCATLWNFAAASTFGDEPLAIGVKPNELSSQFCGSLEQFRIFRDRNSRPRQSQLFGKFLDLQMQRENCIAVAKEVFRSDVCSRRSGTLEVTNRIQAPSSHISPNMISSH